VELQNVHGALGFAFLLSTSKQSSHTHQWQHPSANIAEQIDCESSTALSDVSLKWNCTMFFWPCRPAWIRSLMRMVALTTRSCIWTRLDYIRERDIPCWGVILFHRHIL
jgi:hypothetical protein